MSEPQSLAPAKPQSNQATSFDRSFAPSEDHTVDYTEHRGEGAPSFALGAIGDIYLDTKKAALYARCATGWTPWPGPQARAAPLAHPVYLDHVLWASTQRARVLWIPKLKMKKLIGSAADVLINIIASDGRRDSKNLKRKAGEAPSGIGEAKKPRVSEPAPLQPLHASDAGSFQVPSGSAPPSATKPPPPSTKPAKALVTQNPSPASSGAEPAQVLSNGAPPSKTQPPPVSAKPAKVSVTQNPPPVNSGAEPAQVASSSTPRRNMKPPSTPTDAEPIQGASSSALPSKTKPPPAFAKPVNASVAQSPAPANPLSVSFGPSRIEPTEVASSSAPIRKNNMKPSPPSAGAEPTQRASSGALLSKTKPLPSPAKPVKASVAHNPPPANLSVDANPRVDSVPLTPKPSVKPATSAPPAAVKPPNKSVPSAAKPSASNPEVTSPTPPLPKPSTTSITPTTPLKRSSDGALAEDDISRKRQCVESPTVPIKSRLVQDDAVAKEMEPVEKDLKQFKGSSGMPREDRKLFLFFIGRHIDGVLKRKEDDDRDEWRRCLWEYAALFWFKKADGARLEDGYRKQLGTSTAGSVISTSVASTPSRPSPSPASGIAPNVVQDSSSESAAKPEMSDVLKVMRKNTKHLRSKPAAARQTPSSPMVDRSTAPPARASSAKQANPVVSPVSNQTQLVTTRPAEDMAQDPARIAALQRQYTRYHSEAVTERQMNQRWLAEATAAAALINALVTANDALGRENDAIKAENVLLKGIDVAKRLQPGDEDLGQEVGEPEQVELRPEEQLEVEPPQEEQVELRPEEHLAAELPQQEQVEPRQAEPKQVELPQEQHMELEREEHAEPKREEEQVVFEEDTNDNSSGPDMILIKEEFSVHVPLRIETGHQGREVIDLTWDSDDEDAGTSAPPVVVSSGPIPTAVVKTVSGAAQRDLGGSRGLQNVATADVQMDEEPDGFDVDLQPAAVPQPVTSMQMNVGGDLQTALNTVDEPPSSALVKPSTPGHFRIADFNYTDERLRELVTQNGGENDASPQTWGTILTLLEIFARSASATESIGMSAAVPVHQWPETVKALRDYYYTRYPARRSSALVLPPSASSTDCGSKSPPRERILDAPIAVTADVVSEQGTSPGADAGETLRTPSLSSGTAAVLADPLTCKNTLPQTKVKVESGDLETLGYELAARPVCVRRLNQIHLEELFPTAGNEPVMCTACMTFSCPAETPIEDLSAHMEKQHPELFEVILTKTEGMSPEEIVAWFATLDD